MSSKPGRDLGIAVLAAIWLAACSDSSPTGSSELPSPSSTARAGTDLSFASTVELGSGEDFDCTNVETVRVRFGSPGYAEDDRVGLYVFFGGLPEGPKRLRIWWDNANDPTHFRDHVFPEEATSIEETFEHRYAGLDGPTEMLVRVELIRDGLTGNCPRNRWVLVAPLGAASSSPSTGPQTARVGPPVSAVDIYDSTFDGIRFTALTALTIDSVWVDAAGSGTLLIELSDSTGTTVVSSTTVAVNPGPQQISLGFTISPGDYVLTTDASFASGLGMTLAGTSYPYEIPGVIRLTDTAFYFAPFYYFFYDWQVTW